MLAKPRLIDLSIFGLILFLAGCEQQSSKLDHMRSDVKMASVDDARATAEEILSRPFEYKQSAHGLLRMRGKNFEFTAARGRIDPIAISIGDIFRWEVNFKGWSETSNNLYIYTEGTTVYSFDLSKIRHPVRVVDIENFDNRVANLFIECFEGNCIEQKVLSGSGSARSNIADAELRYSSSGTWHTITQPWTAMSVGVVADADSLAEALNTILLARDLGNRNQ